MNGPPGAQGAPSEKDREIVYEAMAQFLKALLVKKEAEPYSTPKWGICKVLREEWQRAEDSYRYWRDEPAKRAARAPGMAKAYKDIEFELSGK